MNKSFSISLGGLPFFIEDDAYENLRNYLNSIRISLKNEESTEEIIQDVEQRLAELFKEKLGENRQVVNTSDIDYVKSIMGNPEDFVTEDDEPTKIKARVTSASYVKGKQLFRDVDSKILGGVCAGLGKYLGIDFVWVRLFLIVMCFFDVFTFGISTTTIIIAYVIMWIVLPPAVSTSDKLKMEGKPVNFDNIKEFVNIDNAEVKENLSKAGNAVKTGFSGLGDFLEGFFRIIGKILLIFIGILLIFIGLALIIGYIAAIVTGNINFGDFTGYELLMFVFDEKWMYYFGLVLLGILFIIPAFYLIILGLRLISNRLQVKIFNSAIISSIFIWFLALIALGILGFSTASNFSEDAIAKTENYTLKSNSDTLTVYFENFNDPKNYTYRNQNKNGINGFSKDDKNYLINIEDRLEVGESTNNNFILNVVYESRGKSEADAKQNIETITYEFKNIPNQLALNRYMSIAKDKKYRFQDVKLVLLVPKGKYLKTKNIHWVYNAADGFDDDYYFNENDKSKENLFIFEGSNLKCLSCKDDFNNEIDNNEIDDMVDSLRNEIKTEIKNSVKIKSKSTTITIDSTGVKIKKDK